MQTTKFKSLTDFQTEVNDWDETLSDHTALTLNSEYTPDDTLAFTADGETVDLFGAGNTIMQGEEVEAPLTRYALGQLAERLAGPRLAWLADNAKCDPELRSKILNHLLAVREPKTFLYRQREIGGQNTVRAVLSDAYSAFDHKPLVTSLVNALRASGLDGVVAKSQVDDHLRGYLLPINPQTGAAFDFDAPHSWLEGDRQTGDGGGTGGLHPAIYFTNDETGGGSLRITGGLYRSFCSNGAIIGWQTDDSFRLVHRGKTSQFFHGLVSAAIESAMNLTEQAAERFQELQAVHISPGQIGNIVDRWVKRYSAPKTFADAWNTALAAHANADGGLTQWTVINEATFLAQSVENSHDQELIERLAGDMIFAEVPERDLANAWN